MGKPYSPTNTLPRIFGRKIAKGIGPRYCSAMKAARRLLRRLLCRANFHRWQILYEPPHLSTTGDYRKAVFCVHCGTEAPWGPGEFHK